MTREETRQEWLDILVALRGQVELGLRLRAEEVPSPHDRPHEPAVAAAESVPDPRLAGTATSPIGAQDAVIGAIAVASFAVAVIGVARQRRGSAWASRPRRVASSRSPKWLEDLFRACPTSSASRAQIWFELRSSGIGVLAIGLLIAGLTPFVFLIARPEGAVSWSMLSLLAALFVGNFLPSTIGGDVLRVGSDLLVGRSARTNHAAIEQLRRVPRARRIPGTDLRRTTATWPEPRPQPPTRAGSPRSS